MQLVLHHLVLVNVPFSTHGFCCAFSPLGPVPHAVSRHWTLPSLVCTSVSLLGGVGALGEQQPSTPKVWHSRGTEPFADLTWQLKGNSFLQRPSLCRKSFAYFLPEMEKYPGTETVLLRPWRWLKEWEITYPAPPTLADWAGCSANTRAAYRKRTPFVG